MGFVEDLLKEVPLSAVLRERIALEQAKHDQTLKELEEARRRIAVLEADNASLRAQIPRVHQIDAETARVLVHLFKAREIDDRDIGNTARALNMERGVVEYHLDRLHQRGMAEFVGGNYRYGHVYWALTPEGRRHAIETKLV